MDRQTLKERAYRLAKEDPDCWSHLIMYAFGTLPTLSAADRERLYALGLVDHAGRIPPAIRALLDDAQAPS